MRRFLIPILAVSVLVLAGHAYRPASGLHDLQVHDPIHHGNLTIFPISNGSRADTSLYLTLDEGLAQGVVKVGELGALRGAGAMVRPIERRGERPRPNVLQTVLQTISGDQARVNELAIQNLSDRPLLLLAGEVVSGGKQDRVVGRDRIVPPHSEPIPLGVFCVEPGRWHGLSAQFAGSKTMAHPQLRKEVTEARDQQKVWDEVKMSRQDVARSLASPAPAGAAGSAGVPAAVIGGIMSSSSSYAKAMEARPVQDKLDERSRAFLRELPKDAVGVVVAVNGRPVWADLFASPALFQRYRAKLLQSYLVEAMRSGEASAKAATTSEARDFLRELSGRQSIEVEPGVYRLIRTDASGTVTYELQSLPHTQTLHVARMAQ